MHLASRRICAAAEIVTTSHTIFRLLTQKETLTRSSASGMLILRIAQRHREMRRLGTILGPEILNEADMYV